MTTSIDQWQDLTGEVPEDPVPVIEIDDSDQDYSVRTNRNFVNSPWVKIGLVGAGCIGAISFLMFFFLGINAKSSGPVAQQAISDPNNSTPPPDTQPVSSLSQSDRELVDQMLEKETFDRQRDQQAYLASRKTQKGQPTPKPGQQVRNPSRSPSAPRALSSPQRVAYSPPPRPAYVARRSQSSQPPQRARVQRSAPVSAPQRVALAAVEEIDDPNYGFFTAPAAPKTSSGVSLSRSPQLNPKPIPLNRSPLVASNPTSGNVKLFTPPYQIASSSSAIPAPDPMSLNSNLSGNLVNPYLLSATLGGSSTTSTLIPVDTVVSGQIKTRVAWTPENPSLGSNKEIRIELAEDLKGRSGDVVARKGAIAVARTNQATDQGLISATVVSIDGKTIPSGAIEVHKGGDQTMVASLQRKGGKNNSFLKTALNIGVAGAETLARSINQPTSQTALTNGDQTFLSTTNDNRNNTAAFVEGATGRIGEMIQSSATGPEQSAIGIYRLGGDVQLYVVREVQL